MLIWIKFLDPSQALNCKIKQMFDLDNLGIIDDPDGDTDENVLKDMLSKIIRNADGRLVVQWPWKYKIPKIPSNKNIAMGQLRSTWAKVSILQKERIDLSELIENIEDQIARGVIERVPPGAPDGPVSYIPQHIVHKKMRLKNQDALL